MKYLSLILFSFLWCQAMGQNYDEIANLKTGDYEDQTPSVIGLWTVTRVSVGDEELTPTAKWFEFLADGKQRSGNGGMAHGRGSWRFDAAASTLLTFDQHGEGDGYGAFKVNFTNEGMTWERIEDDMKVQVILKRIEEKPLAPWDLITGNWTAQYAETQNLETKTSTKTDLEPYRFYFGWDRRYRKFDSQGKRVEVGIWHIEPHSPWLWLIPYEGEKYGQNIRFEADGMMLETNTGQENTLVYFKRG